MERYKNEEGMMIQDPQGHWVEFNEINGTEEEIKQWIFKYGRHADYPKCQIRKTKECTCGLQEFIDDTSEDMKRMENKL